jgi:hypothetical protein
MLRIQLLPSGEFLDLGTDTTATVELFGTIMNKDSELLGSYAYEFSLPLTERNKRLLNNAHLITSSQSLRSTKARLWLSVTPWKVVKLLFCIKSAAISAELRIDNGIVNKRLKEYKLYNITDGQPDTAMSFQDLDAYRAYMKAAAMAAPGIYPLTFFPIRNEHFLPEVDAEQQGNYPDTIFPQSKYINEWDAVNQQFVVDTTPAGARSHLESPLYYLAYVIKASVKYLGYQLIGNWINNPDIQRLVLDIPIGINLNLPDIGFHMPDIALDVFFKAIRNKFSLLIAFNESDKTCLIESWQNVFAQYEPLDLRPYQIKGIDDYVPDFSGYTITEKSEDKDALTEDNQGSPAIVIGDGSQSVELEISTTHMIVENAPGYGTGQIQWRLPHVDQHYYTSDKYIFLDDVNFKDARKFELRLLYYHGMVKNQNGDLYPYGSADNLDYLNRPLTGFSLSLNENASTVTLAKDFYTFCLNSKKLDVRYLLPELVFMQISNNRPVLIRDINNATVRCLLDQLSADLSSRNNKVQGKAVLYTLPAESNTTGVIPAQITDEPPVDNGPVYVKMRKDMPQIINTNLGDTRVRGTATIIYAQFFADAAGTIPKEVTNILVLFQSERHDNLADEFHTNPNSRLCSGTEAPLTGQVYTTYQESHRVSGVTFETTVSWDDVYSIIKTGDYNVIT